MSFRDALKTRDFVVTAHVNMSRVPDARSLIDQGEALRPAVDAVQVTDNPGAQVHMSGLAASALLLGERIDPVLHMTCRDRNRIALQSDLIGAAALGVTSVLLMRGDRAPDHMKPRVRGVFDTHPRELMAFAQQLKDAKDVPLVRDFWSARPRPSSIPMPRSRRSISPESAMRGRTSSKRNFASTWRSFANYMRRMVEARLTRGLRFFMALSPLPSAEAARWIGRNVRGALVPSAIIERMENATDPEREGVAICAELIGELATIPGSLRRQPPVARPDRIDPRRDRSLGRSRRLIFLPGEDTSKTNQNNGNCFNARSSVFR